MMRKQTKTVTGILVVTVYLISAALACTFVTSLCRRDIVYVCANEPGFTDLTEFDFINQTATLAMDFTRSIRIYADVFYYPDDFAQERVYSEGVIYSRTDKAQGDFGTLRMLLKLPTGQAYAIAGKTASYSQRLFIDGNEYTSSGLPGNTADHTVPKTSRFVQGFVPKGEITEIIIHYANFVYADGGGVYPLDIGLAENITRNEQLSAFHSAVVTASLAVALLFFFGMFLLFPKNRYLLWFGIACGCIGMRSLFVRDKIIMTLLPSLDWFIAIRLEAMLTIGIILFSILYIYSLFPSKTRRAVASIGVSLCVACLIFIGLAPPVFYSRYIYHMVIGTASFAAVLLVMTFVCAFRGRLTSPLSKLERLLLLIGLIVYGVLSAAEIQAHKLSFLLLGVGYTQMGMLIFLFINILVLALGFSRTERELYEARKKEREITETNKVLESLNRVKAQFLGSISHEMKTPLELISGSAGLACKHIELGIVSEETLKKLDFIQREAVLLGKMADEFLNIALEKERRLTLTYTQAENLMKKAADFCAPVCGINKIIITQCPEQLSLYADSDGIYRVLVNLILNANKHTKNATIVLSAENTQGGVLFKVKDNGEGIVSGLLPEVFKWGVSGSGGSGLGLAICKRIVEEHGGSIGIESSEKSGTTVYFTLPQERK